MYPTLDFLGFSLPIGPFSLIVAFYAGLWLAGREAERLGLPADLPWDFGTAALVSGLIAARIWYVIFNWSAYALDWSQVLALAAGSLAVGPGLLTGIVVGLVWIGRHGVDWPAFVDAMAPGLALMQIIASVGAFLSGDAYGAPSNVPWAVEMWGEARHPVQLYEAGVGLAVLGVLWVLRHRKPYAGYVFLMFVFLSATGRLWIEAYSGQTALLPGGLRTAQVVSLLVALGSGAVLYARAAGLIRTQSPDKRIEQQ